MKRKRNFVKRAKVSMRFFVSGLFYLLMLFSCKENDDELKNPKTEVTPSFEDPALTFEAYGGETITLVVNNLDYDQYAVGINGQKLRTYDVSTGTSAKKTKCEIPYGVGSGTIDLIPLKGGNKITGPKFTYQYQYRVHQGLSLYPGEDGISRYKDDSFITMSARTERLEIFKLVGFRAVDNFGSICQFRRTAIKVVPPAQTLWTIPLYGHFASGVTSTGSILTSCLTFGQGGSYNMYETDLNLKQTHFFAGRITAPEYGWIHDLDLDSKDNIYTCEARNWRPKSQDFPYINRTTLQGVRRYVGSEDRGHVDGQGINAMFYHVMSIAIDKNDNLYVADSNYVRKISPGAEVTTIAGNATPGDKDGVGLEAEFNSIRSVYVADDTLYILDAGNNKIKAMDLQNNSVKTLKGITIEDLSTQPKGLGIRMVVDATKNIHIVVDHEGGNTLYSCIRENNVPKNAYLRWIAERHHYSEPVE